MQGTYQVNGELKVKAEHFEMMEYKLLPKEAKSKQLSSKIRLVSLGYTEVFFKVLPSLIESLIRPK